MPGKWIDYASLAIVGFALMFLGRVMWERAVVDETTIAAGETGIPANILIAAATGHRLGPEEAPVNILVFSDYGCSFCQEFQGALDSIRARYPEHVSVVFKHFVALSNDPPVKIAMAAECSADQGLFAPYHSLAMNNPRLITARGGWRIVADSVILPDRDDFNICVESAARAPQIAQDYEQGKELGVNVTPTFFVNGNAFEGAASFRRLDSLVVKHFPRRDR